ncbi:MAG: ABC transporter ATP-binding protein/permease [Clostridia bacterium]|nr:ABC transporter ATP-binding protein/permease [Clostridia bacterium]
MKTTISRIVQLAKPYLGFQVLGFILTLLFSLAVFGSPIVSKYLIDDIIPTHSTEKLYSGLIIFFAVCVSQPVMGYLKDLVFLQVSEGITYDIRQKLFNRVLNAPLTFFEKAKKGEIIARVINDGRGASQFITDFFVVVIKNVFQIAMILGGMLFISVRLTIMIVFLFSIFSLINFLMGKKFSQLSLKLQKNTDALCVLVNQASDSVMSIKALLREDRTREAYVKVLKESYKDNKRYMALSILVGNLTGVVVVISLCLIYGVGSLWVMNGTLTLGAVIAMGLYFQLLVQPISELLHNNIDLNKTAPIFDRLYEYFNLESEKTDLKQQLELKGDIVFKDVRFEYSDQTQALRGINLQIPQNTFSGFMGHSGAGKSTLVKMLLGYYRPTGGEVSIGGMNIHELGVNVLRKNISYVSQDVELFNESVMENILSGNPKASSEEVIEICKQLNLHNKIMSLPDQYHTVISERVNLSGGEKQRIAIARALIKRPAIFIFDEPTSALDPENEEIIKQLLKDISSQSTVLVIAHKENLILDADRVFILEKGQVKEAREMKPVPA